MREEEVATKSRNIHVTILQWQWSPAKTFLRNLEEDKKSIDLDLHNDENRPTVVYTVVQ